MHQVRRGLNMGWIATTENHFTEVLPAVFAVLGA
jgi:hypothetical protein